MFKRQLGPRLRYPFLPRIAGEKALDVTPRKRNAGWSAELWCQWDSLCRRWLRIQPLHPHEEHLFCISQRRHLGPPFAVGNTVVSRFEPVIEIHLNNPLLIKILADKHSLFGTSTLMARETRSALQALAEMIIQKPHRPGRVICGVTLLYRGTRPFGFEVLPIENRWLERFYTWYLQKLLRAMNPDASRRMNQRAGTVAKRIAMPAETLIQRYRHCLAEVSPTENSSLETRHVPSNE